MNDESRPKAAPESAVGDATTRIVTRGRELADLAEAARRDAEEAWLRRRALLCVSVACDSSDSLDAARRTLDLVTADTIRAEAVRLLDELAHVRATGDEDPVGCP